MFWPSRRILREENVEAGGGGGDLPPVPPTPPAPDPNARLEAELARQQAELNKLRMQVTPAVQPQQQAEPPSKEAVEKQFWKDPLAVVDALAQRRAMEVAQQAAAHQGPTLDAMRMYARDRARGTDAFQQKIFDHFYSEIEQLVNAVPPNFQTNPNVWDNAFNQVKGRHIDEISQMKESSTPRVALKDGPGTSSAKAAPLPPKTPLSDEEKTMARNLKMTEDEYRAGKAAYENQEKAWNEVLTFDSDEKRRKERAAAARK